MAPFELEGFEEMQDAFRAIESIPWKITKEAVDAMGAAAAEKVRETGLAMGVRDPESSVHILDNVGHSKPLQTEDGGKSFITIKGSRMRGNKKTRNAEIAFVNEFGAPKRGIRARPFILRAMTVHEEEIAAPAEEIIGDFIEKTFGNG